MTKKEMFAHIKSVNANDAEIVAFCDHEIELLAKKSAGSGKPTKTQKENEVFKSAMLATLLEIDRPVTISELMEICEGIAGLKNQRVSALMTQLKKAGMVTRTEIKKKAYFTIAEDAEADEVIEEAE